jgi:hypothetical protein
MAISPEEMERIARENMGPTMRRSLDTPESRARVAEMRAHLAALEAHGPRPEPTPDQQRIWQAWFDSEIDRINRERGPQE